MDSFKQQQLIKLLNLCLETNDLELIKVIIESVIESIEELENIK